MKIIRATRLIATNSVSFRTMLYHSTSHMLTIILNQIITLGNSHVLVNLSMHILGLYPIYTVSIGKQYINE